MPYLNGSAVTTVDDSLLWLAPDIEYITLKAAERVKRAPDLICACRRADFRVDGEVIEALVAMAIDLAAYSLCKAIHVGVFGRSGRLRPRCVLGCYCESSRVCLGLLLCEESNG